MNKSQKFFYWIGVMTVGYTAGNLLNGFGQDLLSKLKERDVERRNRAIVEKINKTRKEG